MPLCQSLERPHVVPQVPSEVDLMGWAILAEARGRQNLRLVQIKLRFLHP